MQMMTGRFKNEILIWDRSEERRVGKEGKRQGAQRSRRRHTISKRDWSSDVCSSDLMASEGCVYSTPFCANVIASSNPSCGVLVFRLVIHFFMKPTSLLLIIYANDDG